MMMIGKRKLNLLTPLGKEMMGEKIIQKHNPQLHRIHPILIPTRIEILVVPELGKSKRFMMLIIELLPRLRKLKFKMIFNPKIRIPMMMMKIGFDTLIFISRTSGQKY